MSFATRRRFQGLAKVFIPPPPLGRSVRALLPLAVLALLAGCIVEEDPPVAATVTPPTPEPTPQEETPAADVAPAAAPPAPPPTPAPVSYSGRTGRWACAPDGPATCKGVDLGAKGENALFVLPYANATRVEGTLTWTASTPATAKLTLTLILLAPCDAACEPAPPLARVEGASPLAIEADVDLPPGALLALVVEEPQPVDAPLSYGVSVEQAFAFDGVVTLQ